jgi:hypothetical protein
MPVAVSVAVITALGMADPDGSVTVPTMVAVADVCPVARKPTVSNKQAIKILFVMLSTLRILACLEMGCIITFSS